MTERSSSVTDKLFNDFSEEASYASAPKDYQTHLIDQYKLYVEMADKISERRQSANSYFLSVNSGILAFVGYVGPRDQTDYLWFLAIAGMALSFLWYRLIRSYRDLNSAKFKVIHEIEKRLPLSPYDAEWEAMERGENPRLYKPLSHIEIGVPWVFLALHALVLVRTFPFAKFLQLA